MKNVKEMKVDNPSSELHERLALLPDDHEVAELCTLLPAKALRELSAEIIKGSIEYLNNPDNRLEYAGLLSSWIATAEETAAAGGKAKRIAARRKRTDVTDRRLSTLK